MEDAKTLGILQFPNVVDNPDYWYIRMVLLNAEEKSPSYLEDNVYTQVCC